MQATCHVRNSQGFREDALFEQQQRAMFADDTTPRGELPTAVHGHVDMIGIVDKVVEKVGRNVVDKKSDRIHLSGASKKEF